MRKLLHRFELRVAVFAALALLVAQMGAMAHGYSHDGAVGAPTTHQTGAGAHDPCNDCLAYAPLLAGAGATSALPFAPSLGGILSIRAASESLVELTLTLAFRSRAPPVPL